MDVLALGQHLVRELDLQNGVDTLGRWMAHHVAEQMLVVDRATTPEERRVAQEAVTDTILKIWDHRTKLPGNAYPLAPFKKVLSILDGLHPRSNPFYFTEHDPEAHIEKIAGDLFNDLGRLILSLIFLKDPNLSNLETEVSVLSTLDEAEQLVSAAVHEWIELLQFTSGEGNKSNTEITAGAQVKNLTENALHLIRNLEARLAQIRNILEEDTDNKPNEGETFENNVTG